MNTLISIFKLLFIGFGVILFFIFTIEIFKTIKKPTKPNTNKIYMLCERYINIYDKSDGYWLTETEIQLYEELEKHLKRLKVVK